VIGSTGKAGSFELLFIVLAAPDIVVVLAVVVVNEAGRVTGFPVPPNEAEVEVEVEAEMEVKDESDIEVPAHVVVNKAAGTMGWVSGEASIRTSIGAETARCEDRSAADEFGAEVGTSVCVEVIWSCFGFELAATSSGAGS